MISNLESQLAALSAKYEKQRRKLPKPEAEEACKLCGEALVENADGVDLCFRFATALPSECVAFAFAENWNAFDDTRRRQLIERLQRLPEPGGKRLCLALSAALRNADPLIARRLLTQTCYSLLDSKNQRPGKKSSVMFRSVLLDEKEPALLSFQFSEAIQAEVTPLLACVVTAIFTAPEGRPLSFSPIASQVLEWLLRQDLFACLKPEQRTVISAAIASWPRNAKAELADKFDPIIGGVSIRSQVRSG
jgi:hypothetical protein